MSKAKGAVPPPQDRDVNGRFIKGNRGNPGGKPKIPQEVKQFCREKSMKWLLKMDALGDKETTQEKDLIAIARLFLEYGYGRPAAEFDRERLDIEVKRLAMDERKQEADSNENAKIEVIISNQAKEWGE